MTEDSLRKNLIHLSGGCLVTAVIAAIIGLLIGQYSIILYCVAGVFLLLSFVFFYFARSSS